MTGSVFVSSVYLIILGDSRSIWRVACIQADTNYITLRTFRKFFIIPILISHKLNYAQKIQKDFVLPTFISPNQLCHQHMVFPYMIPNAPGEVMYPAENHSLRGASTFF